jgi:hypothetical protein
MQRASEKGHLLFPLLFLGYALHHFSLRTEKLCFIAFDSAKEKTSSHSDII